MMTTTTYETQDGLVKNLRKIRDHISNEIKDMTFEQERAYLDNLLKEDEQLSHEKTTAASGEDIAKQ